MGCGGKCNKRECCNSLESLTWGKASQLLKNIDSWEVWELPHETRLMKSYNFKDFAKALGFVNKIGLIAEKINHHPTIQLEWGKVNVEVWSHEKKDLTKLDFVLAEEIDKII